jgi:hypothetical protein
MTEKTPVKALGLGRDFFNEIVKPAMEKVCPELLDQAACGRFGFGSECMGLDDEISRDHHWGPRVDVMLPEKVFQQGAQELMGKIAQSFPEAFRGYKLEAGHVGGAGLAPEGMDSFLMRSVGRTTLPQTDKDWLDIPEEDIIHIINGEVWHDSLGDFTRLRETYQGYYPDNVWKRRIAHWCRYCSGMGLYSMHRAVLRKNYPYAFHSLGRTMKLTMELTFLLNRSYFFYDKWLYPLFKKLPRLASEIDPLLTEVTQPETSWKRRIALFEDMHDILDADMVAQGLIDGHPKFKKSATQGYRLLESAYGDLCRSLPKDLLEHIPQWDQVYIEKFHSGFVSNLSPDDWRHALGVEPQ